MIKKIALFSLYSFFCIGLLHGMKRPEQKGQVVLKKADDFDQTWQEHCYQKGISHNIPISHPTKQSSAKKEKK